MGARKIWSTGIASLCVVLCAFGVGAVAAMGETTQFGGIGELAGQLDGPVGVGLDQETGDVFIGDDYNQRLSKFDGAGNFLLAWGDDINPTSPAQEPQTCTAATECKIGQEGSAAGEFTGQSAQGVAVDNDPLSASYNDVYVVDFANYRVQKFDPSGKFLLMFGGHVNETKDNTPGATEAEKDVCSAGEDCTRGTGGAADGEFEWVDSRNNIAMGPNGSVYIGDRARVQIFDPSGAWTENISLSSLSSTGKVIALAVSPAGDVLLADEGVTGVREFAPGGVETGTQLDVGSESIEALAVDASGNIFVADSTGGTHFLEYGPTGEEIDSFGSKIVEETKGIAFSETADELYVTDYFKGAVDILSAPSSGPLVEPGSESATPGQRGTATLAATVNPEGKETTYHFEYIAQEAFQKEGYAGASSTPAVSIGSSFEDQSASVSLVGLVPGGTYHYRIVATNSKGTETGPDQTFTTVPPALVEGPWVTNVTGVSAIFQARVNPLGANTQYRFEYGTVPSYGTVLTGSLGEGTAYVSIERPQQELQPNTTYYYRLVTTNEVGMVESTEHTFTTQRVGTELELPDGRHWELVTPPNKKSTQIEPFNESEIQAAADGNGLTYISREAIGEDEVGKSWQAQILSTRVPGGWNTKDITIPRALPGEGESAPDMTDLNNNFYLFSSDLSSAIVEPLGIVPPLAPEVTTERTLYIRDNASGSYEPIVSPSNVLPGAKFGTPENEGSVDTLHFLEGTPDLSHLVFESPIPLTSEPATGGVWNLYEWNAGKLRLVNILPGGESSSVAGYGSAYLGVESAFIAHSVSNDGRWIAWQTGNRNSRTVQLFVRDMTGEKTFSVGGAHAIFQTMNSDGSKVFYLENGDLYEFDTTTGVQSEVTANHGAGASSAEVQNAVVGASEDGSDVYLVAKGVLAAGGVSGEDNLYLLHDSGSEWTTRYIASLAADDGPNWHAREGCINGYFCPVALGEVTSRVSPDGRYLEFMSDRSLTGYDNLDAVSGQPDEEVYLYDAETGDIACASCNPSGARPVGVYDASVGGEGPFYDKDQAWLNHWVAGNVPGWQGPYVFGRRSQYQPRFLSDSGRLFFNSSDALAPQDTNGLMDVYEYEPPGVGSCTSVSITFVPNSNGCVGLITSGTASGESAFLDASENGNDVFFVTPARLTTADYDESTDVYDAHVCSDEVPCVTLPVSSPPCTSGDSCKAAPSPQPEIFGSAPSATFSGAGNVVEETAKAVVKHKKKPAKKKTKHKHAKHKHGKKDKRKAKKARRSATGKASKKGNG
jgi:hypothetical protein